MKSKLKFLTKESLKRKINTKWFKIVNIILAIVIVALINLDSIIKLFGGDFNSLTKVYIIDSTNYTYDILKEQINNNSIAVNGETSSFDVIKYDKTVDEAKEEIKDNNKILLLTINSDEEKVLDVTLFSDGYIDTLDYQILYQSINTTKSAIAMSLSNIDQNELSKITDGIEINRVILDETKKTEDESMETIVTTVFPVVIIPFFMLTIFLVQMIGMEVNDEKTTRGMEIIISNVSPKTHFFSKVIAGNAFVIMQAVLLFIYAMLGMLVRNLLGSGSIFSAFGGGVSNILDGILQTEFMSKLIYIVPLTLVLMILTFIAYSLLAGILASMTTNAEDFSQLQTPLMIISLVGYYLAMIAGMFKGAIFIRILSYVPLISAILSPSLLVLGQIGVVDVIISLLLVIFTNYLLIKYGLRIYKEGILNYSSKDLWKKMFKALKNKDIK